MLIGLYNCTGGSAPLLFAYQIEHVSLWPNSIIVFISVNDLKTSSIPYKNADLLNFKSYHNYIHNKNIIIYSHITYRLSFVVFTEAQSVKLPNASNHLWKKLIDKCCNKWLSFPNLKTTFQSHPIKSIVYSVTARYI